MDDLVKVDLPSGAKLEVNASSWPNSKALYKAVARDAIALKVDDQADVDANFWKDLLLTAVASDAIEESIWKCMDRVTYNGVKVTRDTFEPVSAREDYLIVLFEVAQVNIRPFTKSLFARFAKVYGELQNFLASRSAAEKSQTS